MRRYMGPGQDDRCLAYIQTRGPNDISHLKADTWGGLMHEKICFIGCENVTPTRLVQSTHDMCEATNAAHR